MPAAGGRRGRRDNGLEASAYAPVGDVDPRIGEHLLDVLGAAGIAAYLQPSTDQHPLTRTTSLPARPTDRLFVDRAHVETARDFVRQVSSEPDAQREPPAGEPAAGRKGREPARDEAREAPAAPDDVDAAWQEIVAGYHQTIDPADAPWPRSEEVVLGEPRPLPQIDPAEPRTLRRVDPAEPSLLDALDSFGVDPFGGDSPDDDDDDGYTPPPPPPLPRISKAAALGIAAIVFGLLLFIWPGLLPIGGDSVLLLGFASVVAGFGTLIWRLRPGDDGDDEDPDDGARV